MFGVDPHSVVAGGLPVTSETTREMPSSAHGPAFFSFPSSCHWLLATGYCLLSASQRRLDRQPHAHRRGRVEVADDGDSPDLVGFEQGVHPGRAASKPYPAPRARVPGAASASVSRNHAVRFGSSSFPVRIASSNASRSAAAA